MTVSDICDEAVRAGQKDIAAWVTTVHPLPPISKWRTAKLLFQGGHLDELRKLPAQEQQNIPLTYSNGGTEVIGFL